MKSQLSVLTWVGLGLTVVALALLGTFFGQQILTGAGTGGGGGKVGTCNYIKTLVDPVSGETRIVGESVNATDEECAALAGQYGSQWSDSTGGFGGQYGEGGSGGESNGENCTYLPGGGIDTANCTGGLGGDEEASGEAGLTREDINFLRGCYSRTGDLDGCVELCESNGLCAGAALDLPAAAREYENCINAGGSRTDCIEHLEDYEDDLEDAFDDRNVGEETFEQTDLGDLYDNDLDEETPNFDVQGDCLDLGVPSSTCYQTCVNAGFDCVQLNDGTLDDVQNSYEPTFDVRTCEQAGYSESECLQKCSDLGNQCQEYADNTLVLPLPDEEPTTSNEEPGDLGGDGQGPPPGIRGFTCSSGDLGGTTASITTSQVQDCLDAGHEVCAYDSNGNLVVCSADAEELADAIIDTGKEFGLYSDEPFTADHDPATGPEPEGADAGIKTYCADASGNLENLSTQAGVSNCLNEGLTVCIRDAFGNGECADSQSEYEAGLDALFAQQGQNTEEFANQYEYNVNQSEINTGTDEFADGMFNEGKAFDFNSRGSCFDGANSLQYTFSMQNGMSAIANCIGRGGYATDEYGYKSSFASKWADYLQRHVRNGNYRNLPATHF